MKIIISEVEKIKLTTKAHHITTATVIIVTHPTL